MVFCSEGEVGVGGKVGGVGVGGVCVCGGDGAVAMAGDGVCVDCAVGADADWVDGGEFWAACVGG